MDSRGYTDKMLDCRRDLVPMMSTIPTHGKEGGDEEDRRAVLLERPGMANALDDALDEELGKKCRLEGDRDISERVALGIHIGSGAVAAGGAGGGL